MTEDILVSVVMVTYNHEKYIKKAINSVLCQKLDGKIEILIGDDGSSDSTVEILNSYAENNSNIKLFVHENKGLSQNVYELFMNARGKYIAILEGDDYWIDENKLKKQIACLEEKKVLAVACNSIIIDSEEKVIGKWSIFDCDKEITRKEIERYQHLLFHPSAVLFKNIFVNSKNKYHIIASAHRMSGNHTGLINLLGAEGKIYLCNESYTVWRKVTGNGTNFSAKKNYSLEDYYSHFQKYIRYKDYYKTLYNFDDYIFTYFFRCQKCLIGQLSATMGTFWFMKLIGYAFKRCWYKTLDKIKALRKKK